MKMLKRMTALILALMLMMATLAVPAFAAGASVSYRSHCENIGWGSFVKDGAVSGTQERGLRMEDLQIKLSGISGSVEYQAHCQNYGWRGFVKNGASCGTSGQGLRMEAVRIKLTGAAADSYDIYYRVHVSGIGTMGWVKNGETAGTEGQSRQIESIEIKLVAKNSSSGWQWPMSSYRVTQSFNSYSSTMAKKGRPYHCGIDMVSSNTRVVAAADGVVEYAGYTSGNGNHIVLSHTLNGKKVYSLYSHLSSMAVSKGQSISKGAYLGVMGNTGNSTGAHLHFAIFSGSMSTDPVGYGSGSGTNKLSHGGRTFYNPSYVISNGRLP